jgi:hypothetical protein
MAGPVYKLWMCKPTEPWYQLSEEQRDDLSAKVAEAREQAGGKAVLTCSPLWSSEQWVLFGVEEFPDIEAVQKHTEDLWELEWFRYMDSTSMLGTEWPSA